MKQPRIVYAVYLQSMWWKQLREHYYRSKLPKRCNICGAWKNLILHHRTYNYLYKEKIGIHVRLICRLCHKQIHFPPGRPKTPLTWKALMAREQYLKKRYILVKKRILPIDNFRLL